MIARMEPPARPPDRIVDGDLEPTGFHYQTWVDRPTLLDALFGRRRWVLERRERWGRKRFEYWDEPALVWDDSDPTEIVVRRVPPQTIGRSYMVPEPRYHAVGAPPLPQTCARDTLEDEMGYEAATAHIGHRDALMGYPV